MWIAIGCVIILAADGFNVRKTADLLCVLARSGFGVVPVLDRDYRYGSKVSSVTITLDRELSGIDLMNLRYQALEIPSRLNNGKADDTERFLKERIVLDMKLTIVERVISFHFPMNL